MLRGAAAFTVISRARFSSSVLSLHWDMVLDSCHLVRPGGNGLVTLQLLARSCSAAFRNWFSADIGKIDQDKLTKAETKKIAPLAFVIYFLLVPEAKNYLYEKGFDEAQVLRHARIDPSL
jgi:hypothetical protein